MNEVEENNGMLRDYVSEGTNPVDPLKVRPDIPRRLSIILLSQDVFSGSISWYPWGRVMFGVCIDGWWAAKGLCVFTQPTEGILANNE